MFKVVGSAEEEREENTKNGNWFYLIRPGLVFWCLLRVKAGYMLIEIDSQYPSHRKLSWDTASRMLASNQQIYLRKARTG